LAHFFPRDATSLMALGRESGDSRIWAGIHYPMDITAGQQLAERVAARAIERAKSDGAERTCIVSRICDQNPLQSTGLLCITG
jgi:hypothetical protein